MSLDPSEDPRAVATEQLQALGLSTYAARTYVALVALGNGSARDVSRVADVPRTRVYDAVDELRDRGLADVQESTPKQFWPVSTETSQRRFRTQFETRLDRLSNSLEDLEPDSFPEQQTGVWTVTNRSSVTDRVVEFVNDADDEVAFVTVEQLLTDRIVEALRGAGERGVSIRIAGVSNPVEDEICDEVPDVEPFESLWEWTDVPAGRLLLVDRERTLASVLVENRPGTDREETAIWGSGEHNGLVVVLKAIFTWELDERD